MNATLLIHRAILALVVGITSAFLFLEVVFAQDATSPEGSESLLDDLESAWAHRKAATKSVTFTAEIAGTTKGWGEQPPEEEFRPLTEARPTDDLRSKVAIEYVYEQDKIGLTRSSDGVVIVEEPDGVRPQKYRATFDGQVNATLVEETELPMGTIEKKTVAMPYMTVHADTLAVGLWLYPKKVLEDVGWSADKMTVVEGSWDVDGVSCKRVRIPRDSRRWTSTLDVDPENGWVPMRWQTWFDGNLSLRLTFKYSTDEYVGPIVKGWEYIRYNKEGESESARIGVIKAYEVNSDVDDSRFRIDFPTGTHVSETIDGHLRYFIQTEEGLEPLDARDYGKIRGTGEGKPEGTRTTL